MKKLIITFAILFVIFVIARVVFEFYIYAVPVFAVLLTPLVWLSVGAGVLVFVFSGIAVYKELKSINHKPKEREGD